MPKEFNRSDRRVVGIARPARLASLGPESKRAGKRGSFAGFKEIESAFPCAVELGREPFVTQGSHYQPGNARVMIGRGSLLGDYC